MSPEPDQQIRNKQALCISLFGLNSLFPPIPTIKDSFLSFPVGRVKRLLGSEEKREKGLSRSSKSLFFTLQVFHSFLVIPLLFQRHPKLHTS